MIKSYGKRRSASGNWKDVFNWIPCNDHQAVTATTKLILGNDDSRLCALVRVTTLDRGLLCSRDPYPVLHGQPRMEDASWPAELRNNDRNSGRKCPLAVILFKQISINSVTLHEMKWNEKDAPKQVFLHATTRGRSQSNASSISLDDEKINW